MMGLGQSATQSPERKPSSNVVVLPIDPSKQAETAFEWYVQNVHSADNKVIVVHCEEIPPLGPYFPEHTFKTQAYSEMLDDIKDHSNKLKAKYEKKMEDKGIKGQVYSEIGKPGEVIINCVDKFQAGHVVMGTRGFGLIRRTILGSVSEYVVHHSKVPVTVVPREMQRWFF